VILVGRAGASATNSLDTGHSRTYVRDMGLVWRQQSLDRWVGFDDDGHQVGHVGLVVTAGGEHHFWHGWRRDGTPNGVDVGAFPTPGQAMVAVDEARSSPA
jgi:hypothetical protein